MNMVKILLPKGRTEDNFIDIMVNKKILEKKPNFNRRYIYQKDNLLLYLVRSSDVFQLLDDKFGDIAIIGSDDPINLATKTVITSVIHTMKATSVDTLSITNNLPKLAIAKVIPQSKLTLISFQITLNVSLNSISSKDKLRITETLA